MGAAEEPQITLQTTLGKTRLALQFGILGLVGFLVVYVTLISDRHNDGRYVALTDYQRDRIADEKLRDALSQSATRRLDEQDKTLSEIRADIKELLREARAK